MAAMSFLCHSPLRVPFQGNLLRKKFTVSPCCVSLSPVCRLEGGSRQYTTLPVS